MAYMLLIVEPQGHRGGCSSEQGEEAYAQMLDYTESLRRKGVLIESNSLKRSAARVTVREGKAKVVDGPFTESKELIGGFFLLDCATHQEALAYARECPAAQWVSVEVRCVGPCYE